MRYVFGLLALFAGLIFWMLFGDGGTHDVELAHFPLDGPPSITHDRTIDVRWDPEVSSDGRGSLRVDFDGTNLLSLARVPGKGEDLSFRQLVFEAKLKTEATTGPVFLVMQAGIHQVAMPVVGSEGAIRGTHDWTPISVVAGNPANTHHVGTTTLQLQVQGKGTAWIDDLRLLSRQHL